MAEPNVRGQPDTEHRHTWSPSSDSGSDVANGSQNISGQENTANGSNQPDGAVSRSWTASESSPLLTASMMAQDPVTLRGHFLARFLGERFEGYGKRGNLTKAWSFFENIRLPRRIPDGEGGHHKAPPGTYKSELYPVIGTPLSELNDFGTGECWSPSGMLRKLSRGADDYDGDDDEEMRIMAMLWSCCCCRGFCFVQPNHASSLLVLLLLVLKVQSCIGSVLCRLSRFFFSPTIMNDRYRRVL